MGAKYTNAQKNASLKYQKDRAQIKITVSHEQRDRYKKHAERVGSDLTKIIVRLLEKDIEESGESTNKCIEKGME